MGLAAGAAGGLGAEEALSQGRASPVLGTGASFVGPPVSPSLHLSLL